MDSDLVLSLVLFGFLFFGFFFCYYSAQVRIKHDERALSDSEHRLLRYHQQQHLQHLIFGQPNEINTVSRHAELQMQFSEMPPEYGKVGLPPSYDLVVAGNPPPYSEAIQRECNACVVLPPVIPTTRSNEATTTTESSLTSLTLQLPTSVVVESVPDNLTSIQVIPQNEAFSAPQGTTVISPSALSQSHSFNH